MPDVSELRGDFIYPASSPAPIVRLRALEDEAGECEAALSGSRALGPACIVLGAFDGVHRGHRALIEACVSDARSRGISAVAVTFDPDPDAVVGVRPAPKLTATDDRLELLRSSGVDAVAVVPFSRALAALDLESFFVSVLGRVLDIRSVHVGKNFHLGRGGAAGVAELAAWGASRGIAVTGHDLVLDGDGRISSTRIRAYLASGDVGAAAFELGRRYLVRGCVHTGRGEGTGMGFPTANVRLDARLALPAEGVYSGLALVRETVWPAAINVGVPPTFKDRAASASFEANLIGFSGDIYGEAVAFVFDERLRGPKTFGSLDDLIACVLGNIDDVKRRFGERGVVLA